MSLAVADHDAQIKSGVGVRSIFAKIAFLLIGITGSAAHARNVTLLVYVDQSTSMRETNFRLADLIMPVAQRIGEVCREYRVAVSTISYVDAHESRRLGFPAIKGTPRFVRKSDGVAGLELIKGRIEELAKNPEQSMNHEKLHTTIVESFKKEPDIFQDTDFVATLMLSDAPPTGESYSARGALGAISSLWDLQRFAAFGVTPAYLPKPKCVTDKTPRPAYLLSEEQRMQAQLFFKLSGGLGVDFCSSDLESEIDRIVDLILASAQCLQIM